MAFSVVTFLKGILIQDPVDRTKQLEFDVSPSATTGTKTTIVAQQTGNRLVTLPDSDFDFNEVITETSVSTLSNKTLDNTTIEFIKDANLTLENASDTTKRVKFDLSGVSTGTTRTIPLPDSNSTLANISSAQTFSNKTLDNTTVETIKANNLTIQDPSDVTKQVQLNVSAVSTGTTRTVSIPDASLIIVGTATTQTLTNKTLSGNIATNLVNSAGTLNLNSSGVITVPNATDTLVGKATTDILSNKSFPSVVLNGSVSGTATIAAANTTSSYSIKLPASQGATSTVPQNDGSGNLSWASVLTNPMTTGGDIIYGAASGVPTRLANGSVNQYLKSNGGTAAPTWDTIRSNITSQTSNYSALVTDDVILVSGATFAVTLFDPTVNQGRQLKIKKTDAVLGNVITISPFASETIDGNSSVRLNTLNEEYTLVSDGTNWQILSHYTSTAWTNPQLNVITATTSNPSKGTVFVDKLWWRRVGDSAEIRIEYRQTTGGTAGSGDYLFAIPSGLVIDINKVTLNGTVGTGLFTNTLGVASSSNGGAASPVLAVTGFNTTNVRLWSGNSAAFINSGLNQLSSVNVSYTAAFTVPIDGWTN